MSKKKQGAKFNLDDYVDVNERIQQFYRDFPYGSIQTDLAHHDDGDFIFKASVYRNPFDEIPTVGWAREVDGSSYINKTSALENCETSAIGRALANMGYATSVNRPSREEMAKVERMSEEHQEYLKYIARVGSELSGTETLPDGTNLREHLRARWVQAEKQFKVARQVYDALREIMGESD